MREVIARKPFTYDSENLDRGQVIELHDCRNDDKLLGLKYFELFNASQYSTVKCDDCGAKFVGEQYKLAHRAKEDCKDLQGQFTKRDVAEILDVDPDKLKIDIDDSPIQPPAGGPL